LPAEPWQCQHRVLERSSEEVLETTVPATTDEACDQGLFQRLPVGMFRARADGRVLEANPVLAQMLGFDREALLATNVSRLFADEQDGSFWRGLLQRDGALRGAELELRRSDGGNLWARVHARATRDATGGLLLEGVVEDVTDRKRAEDWLWQSQQRLELVNGLAARAVRGAPTGELLHAALRALRELFPARRATYGAVDAHGVLQVTHSLAPHGAPSSFPATRNLATEPAVLAALRAGKVVRTRAGLAAPLRHSERLVGVTCLEAGSPRHFSQHEVLTLAALAEYLSMALKEARLQAELEQAAREWMLTFDALATAIMVLDGTGRVTRLNQAALELLGAADYDGVIGRRPEELSRREPWTTVARLKKRLDDGEPANAEVHDPESDKTWLVTLRPMDRGPGGDEGCLLTARDLSEIVALQQALGRTQTMAAMGSLVAGVAHEVRNPLFSISATLDAFELQFQSLAEAREHIGVLRKGVGRLSDLMAELLEYGRPNDTRLTADCLRDVLEDAIESCRPQAAAAGATVADQIGPGLPSVPMERRRLMLVFRNVVENALHHTPPGGLVTVEATARVEAGARIVECLVRDQGPGFHEQDLSRVFEPFYTRRPGGTGLGLAIAQRIVHEHGGSIAVFNHPAGGGAVSVRLPSL
jgi:PAS domain S-box-containing protein